MAEEGAWENERNLEHLDIHGGEGEEDFYFEEDIDNEENYYFGQVEDDNCEYEDSDAGTYYSEDSEDDETRRVIDKPFDYNVLPFEIWNKIFRQLSRWEMCKIAMVCPFFYKIVGADFKRFCVEFGVFKLVDETYVCAFDCFFTRNRFKPGVPYNYKTGLYFPERQVITVVNLNLNDTNMTVIPAREKPKTGWEPYFYYDSTRLSYSTVRVDMKAGTFPDRGEVCVPFLCPKKPDTGVYYHDAQTGALLAYIDLTDRDYHWVNYHYTYYYIEDTTAILFSGISLEFRQVNIPRQAFAASAGYNDQHEYIVFRSFQKIIVYDSRMDTRLEIAAPFKRTEYRETQVLGKAYSLIDGDARSFRIYNIQTGVLLLDYPGKPKQRDVNDDRDLFIIINDFIVVERGKKQIFFYDQNDQIWKNSKQASPRVQQQLYRHVFGSSLLAKTIWHVRTDLIRCGFRDCPTLKKIIEERLEGAANCQSTPTNA